MIFHIKTDESEFEIKVNEENFIECSEQLPIIWNGMDFGEFLANLVCSNNSVEITR